MQLVRRSDLRAETNEVQHSMLGLNVLTTATAIGSPASRPLKLATSIGSRKYGAEKLLIGSAANSADASACQQLSLRYPLVRFRQVEWIWRPEPSSASIAARAVALLGATITDFESNEDGNLAINFSNGLRLTILDSSSEYVLQHHSPRPEHHRLVLKLPGTAFTRT